MSGTGVAAEATEPRFRLPHPVVLLLIAVAVAALCTWLIPAGEYQRAINEATGRTVVVPGTYATIDASPVGLFALFVAIPRGIAEGADVIATILFVGAAFVFADRLGTLTRFLGALATRLGTRGMLALPMLALWFGTMGALENMQEEVVAMVPVLLVLGRRLGVDALTMAAVSIGAAAVGAAFGPPNPYQAGIALKIAELPLLEGAGMRLAMWAAALALWTWWTMRHAARNRIDPEPVPAGLDARITGTDILTLILTVGPILIYVVGVLTLDWGFDELSAAAVVGMIGVGVVNRLGATRTVEEILHGMQAMLPAAMIVALARSIALVLADGHVIDTILHAAAAPLSQVGPLASGLLMIPVQSLIHIPMSSVSGQAALTMPIMAPLADLVGMSRQVAVLAYQTGAGLMEPLTPTNGAMLAVLLAAGVPYQKWLRFAIVGWALATAVGVVGIVVAYGIGM
ncbi:MAG TPA: Na+/H+ antiporter NhaC family protein [Gemmatimonadales bacterium]|nr:Na+/H+ antiporter NhaC family protein [Gemmatimonadales bacterium]